MRRCSTFLLVPLSCALVACGSSDSNSDGGGSQSSATEQSTSSSASAGASKGQEGTVDEVKVTGAAGERPKVTFSSPMSFASTESSVVSGTGKGPKAKEGSTVTANYLLTNATTGKVVEESWKTGQTARLSMGSGLLPGLNKGLADAQAGQRILVTMAAADAFGDRGQGQNIKPGDSLVWVVDVTKVDPPKVVKPVKPTKDVPTLKTGGNGDPTGFQATSSSPKKLDKLGVWTLKEGDGPAVQAGQTIEVNYLGALYPDGKVFDQSYTRGQTASFPIGVGRVIPGWDQGLVGQKVGSRLVLTIPSNLAYGAAGSPQGGIPGNADLIFVVDIVGVQ